MQILKSTSHKDHVLAVGDAYNAVIYDKIKGTVRLYLKGEGTALFVVELGANEINRINNLFTAAFTG